MNSTIQNLYNCECGGLRHICAKHGHLPESRQHYKRPAPKPELTVVWAGRGELLDPRPERRDARIYAMPTFDLDDGEGMPVKEARAYNRTGRYAGLFSRTNPNVPYYKPTAAAPAAMEETNGGDTSNDSGGGSAATETERRPQEHHQQAERRSG